MQATCPVIVDFTQHQQLQETNTANKKVTKAIKNTTECIDVLVLRYTAVSGKAIMSDTELPALEKLRVVDFSNTNASLTAVDHLSKFRHLRMAFFDRCPRIILTTPYPRVHETLEVLSLLGTRVLPGAARHILTTFPNLKQFSYTINSMDQKLLGLQHSKALDGVDEVSVRICKIEGLWQVFALDAELLPIKDGQTLYIHNHKIYTRRQKEAQEIIAQLKCDVNVNEDFTLEPTRLPYHILKRGLTYQAADAIRKESVNP